jgi:glutamate racemase
MNEGFIAVLDSGIGGISVLNEMIKLMPNERYLYFGDNKNAPYGNRTKTDLTSITFKNIDIINRYKIKALVIGCNTISTTILDCVSKYAGVPTLGVFPPVELALMQSDRVLMLSTIRTAKEYEGVKDLSIVGLSCLARDIEDNIEDFSKINLIKNLYDENNVYFGNLNIKNNKFDTVILGCTHYNFIKNKIYDHFQPQILIDGSSFTARKVYEFYKNEKSLVKNKRFSVKFIGENAQKNEKFFYKSGQTS